MPFVPAAIQTVHRHDSSTTFRLSMGLALLVQELHDKTTRAGSEPFAPGMRFAAPFIHNGPSQMRGYGQQARAFRYTVVTHGFHARSLLVHLQSRPAARSR
jgi:hypothetical protein